MRALLVEFEGKDEKGNVFESTKGEVAKALYGKEGPLLVIVGFDNLLPGVERFLKDAKKGEEKELELSPRDAFGYRDPKLVQTYPLSQFKRSNVMPQVGDVFDFNDGVSVRRGIVTYVGSGRVVVDFNHPLAGKKVFYRIKVLDELKGKELYRHLKERFSNQIEDIVDEGEEIYIIPKDKGVKALLSLMLIADMLSQIENKKVYIKETKEFLDSLSELGEVKEGKIYVEGDADKLNRFFKTQPFINK